VAVLCKAYMTEIEARRAVSSLLAAGVPGGEVRILMGEALRDSHLASVGGFAGATGPDAPVGSFAGPAHAQSESMGSFAGGRQRGGSFGDLDRDTVTTYPDGVKRVRIAGHRDLKRTLIDAGLDEDSADRDVRALHDGLVLVLCAVEGIETKRAQALLDAAQDA
jgi:hypothetical protein